LGTKLNQTGRGGGGTGFWKKGPRPRNLPNKSVGGGRAGGGERPLSGAPATLQIYRGPECWLVTR